MGRMLATLVPGPIQITLWQAARLPVLTNDMVFRLILRTPCSTLAPEASTDLSPDAFHGINNGRSGAGTLI
jgi:hypothetical protein